MKTDKLIQGDIAPVKLSDTPVLIRLLTILYNTVTHKKNEKIVFNNDFYWFFWIFWFC